MIYYEQDQASHVEVEIQPLVVNKIYQLNNFVSSDMVASHHFGTDPVLNNEANKKQKNQLNSLSTNFKNQCSFKDLDPWGDNDFEILDYHNKQEMLKTKTGVEKKTQSLGMVKGNQNFYKDKYNLNRSCYSNFSPTYHKQCRSKMCSSRTQGQQKRNQLSTIKTSYQEKLRRQWEMQIMMRKHKKMSNLMKLKHFGHFKNSVVFEKQNKHSRSKNCMNQNQQQKERDSSVHNIEEQNRNSPIKIQRKDRKNIQIDQLCQILKTFSDRKTMMMKMIENNGFKERNNRDEQKQRRKSILTIGSLHESSGNPRNSNMIIKKITFKTGSKKKKVENNKSDHIVDSKIINKSAQFLKTQQNQGKGYISSSIKNRLILLKSKIRLENTKYQKYSSLSLNKVKVEKQGRIHSTRK